MKKIITINIFICYLSSQIYQISILEDFKKIKSDNFYLAWSIPATSEFQTYYYRNGNSLQLQTQSSENFKFQGDFEFDLTSINIDDQLVLLISFENSKSDVKLAASFNQKIINLPESKTIYWAGQQLIDNSYRFLRRLVETTDDENALYYLLLSHDKPEENFTFFKEKYQKTTNEEKRKKFVYWIGRSKADDAVPFLINEFKKQDSGKLNKEILYALYKTKNESLAGFMNEVVLNTKYSDEIRKEGIYLLRKRGSGNLETLFKNYLDVLTRESLLKEVVYYVFKSNLTESKSILKSVSTNDKFSKNIRKEAIYYLYKSSSLEDLKSTFSAIEDVNLKKEIIYHLYKLKTSESAAELNLILSDTKNEFILRKEALYYISKTPVKSSKEIISNLASNSNEGFQLRKEAVYYLFKKKAFQEMKQVYILSDNEKLQKELVYYCYKLDTDESIDFLAKLIKLPTTSSYLKKEVLHYLGESKRSNARTVLNEILN